MGMTREEFGTLAKGMKAVYPQPTFLPDKDAFDIWYELLKDIPYEIASTAIQKHMVSNKFPPTIAEIRENVASIIPHEREISELEAWNIVYKAIGKSNYYADEEFENFPESIKAAVGNPANLREWAQMDLDTVRSVEQSHFIRCYRSALERKKQDAKLPEHIKIAIRNSEQKLIGGQ